MPIWILLVDSVFAGPGFVARPLDPSVGVRFGDRVQLDLLASPFFQRTQQQFSIDLDDVPLPGDQTARTWGVTLDAVGRMGFTDEPTRPNWVLGMNATFESTTIEVENFDTSEPNRETSFGAWTGPGVAVKLTERWSLGADLELFSIVNSTTRAPNLSPLDGIVFTSTTDATGFGIFTGAHLWLAYRGKPRGG